MDIALAVVGAVALWCVVAVAVAVVIGRMCVRRDDQVSRRATPPAEPHPAEPTPHRRPGS